MFVLLFFDKLMGFLGEGPYWFFFQSNPQCDKYWWTNLLYINNFYPTTFNDQVSCLKGKTLNHHIVAQGKFLTLMSWKP